MATKKKKLAKKKPTKPQAKKKAAAPEPKAPPQRRRSPGEAPASHGEILDNSARRDILGVCYIVLGVVLMIIVCMPPSEAFFNGIMSTGLHFLLGIGCYVLPIFLVAVGIAYIYKSRKQQMSARIGIGTTIIYISLLAVFAMFAPVQSMGNDNIDALFSDEMLVSYGGYIGSALTWAGIKFLGRAITGVLLAAFMVIGLIIIGFSISRPIERAKFKRQASEPLAPQRHRQQTSGFARVRVADDRDIDVDDIYRQMRGVGNSRSFDPNRTAVFGAPSSGEEYLELPKPQFLQNLYPDEFPDEDDARTSRLDVAELTENNTRRLLPIEHADSIYSARNAYDGGFAPEDTGDEEPYAGRYISGKSPYTTSYYGEEGLDSSFDRPYADERAFEYVREEEEPEPLAYEPSYSPYSDDDAENDVYESGSASYSSLDAYTESYDIDDVDDIDIAPTSGDAQPQDEPAIQDIYIDGMKTLSVRLDDDADSIRIPSLEPLAVATATPVPEVSVPEISVEEEPAPSPAKKAKQDKPKRQKAPKAAPAATGGKFKLPSMSLLQKAPRTKKRSDKDLANVAATLQKTLADFGVAAEVVDWIAGPTVTLFEVNLPAGVRVSRVTALNDDIALALAAPGIRIFAPVPGTNYVGIEVPNAQRETVYLSDVLGNAEAGPLQIAIGKDVEGHSIVSDLAKMPHLLIGGTTGSGKSVAINAMIMSILMRATPDEVRFILVDPKRVEFTPYNGIPHLYVPVVTEPKEAASALAWGVAEMERRLKVFSAVGARNITQYNSKAKKHNAELEAAGASDLPEDEQEEPMEVMPYIVIVIDELADLMMNVGKDVETSISRIAQLARAAGIHLIVATQRPSTNVVTGLIKANITNRIAFNVASSIDSRVILDSTGAENLIGLGDLLLSKPELAKPQRIQACFISESEIEKVVDFVKAQGVPEYHTEILNTNTYSLGDTNPQGGSSSNLDPLTWEAAGIVVSSGMGSTSNLQRRLKVGYARAGRIMDQLEELGVVGSANGSKPREVLVDEAELAMIRDLEEADE